MLRYKQHESRRHVGPSAGDGDWRGLHTVAVQTTPPDTQRAWFLPEWMGLKGRRQADIIRDLGWERGRVSRIYNGRQDYTRKDVLELAGWLGIEPYELLLHPRQANQFRDFQAYLASAAERVANEAAPPRPSSSPGIRHAAGR